MDFYYCIIVRIIFFIGKTLKIGKILAPLSSFKLKIASYCFRKSVRNSPNSPSSDMMVWVLIILCLTYPTKMLNKCVSTMGYACNNCTVSIPTTIYTKSRFSAAVDKFRVQLPCSISFFNNCCASCQQLSSVTPQRQVLFLSI